MSYFIGIADSADTRHAARLSEWYQESSEERGTGIAVRTEEYLTRKILRGKSIIAKDGDILIGFCYIEDFENKQYVSNSGLIVHSDYRGKGIAKQIKVAAFQLARNKYPNARIFGITTSDIVMKLNSQLGYIPVPLHKLTQDDEFWNGCSSCKNFDILMRNNKQMCLCTGMLAPSKREFDQQQKTIENDITKK